ncbi:MAG: mevalonate kinase [Myxococcales bacterium]|nr:mevalonate kinase [Myxococcales bacterium]USN51240.1 MAG: mevalonate kinase [Myxococcales bacterium]
MYVSQPSQVAFSYAPGKVILVGEHAVVYGAKAIAVPIDCGVRVAVMPRPKEYTGAEGPVLRGLGPFFMGEAYLDSTNGPQVLKSALSYLRNNLGKHVSELAIVVEGSLPLGTGLGSSAALSVALVKGVFRYLSREADEFELERHVMALESIFHGQASGIDHAVIMRNVALSFRKTAISVEVHSIKLASPITLVLGIAGPHEGTKNAVRELGLRKNRQEKAYEHIFLGLDQIADEMEFALIQGHKSQVGDLMNIAQGYLNALSLSTPQVEKLCAIARERGALGAKLTGAGGGGAVIALADGNETDIFNAFKAAGYQSLIVQVRPNELS